MGTAKVSDSSSGNQNARNESETDVILNVYDLTPYNNYTYWVGFGIYHSGIEVHGKEYGFGAHDFPISGVFEVEPKSCPGFIYRCSISLGRVDMPSSEFRTFIEDVASEYHGDTYHLISKNCSLCSCLLPESLQVTKVKELPEYHDIDGSDSASTSTPRDSPEIEDTDQEKHLLSSKDGNSEIAFIKEAQVCWKMP
ncbi:hypothetical protein V6N11_066738 [Hibiscus sabdariffa]|uniref:PPPDE domain-containing protein n=1 Tax=Hibiscus sabdariffa TaxID=183260 RepID=A0ABR2SP25_9ROSI